MSFLPSAAKRNKQQQAFEWHSKLVKLETNRSRQLTEKISALMEEQQTMLQMASKALVQNKASETLVETLYEAQRALADGMKMGFAGDDDNCSASLGTIDTSHDNAIHNDGGGNENPLSRSSSCMERTSRLMVRRIEKIGVGPFQKVLERLRSTSAALMQQHQELQQIGRTATKALQESQIKVQQAWDKYLMDATSSIGSGNKSTQTEAEPALTQGVDAPGSVFSAEVRGVLRDPSLKRVERDGRDDAQKRSEDRNNSLRAMENVANLTASLPSTDTWLSEWGYRAHVMEQMTLYDQAAQRMQQLFSAIKDIETNRRFQLRQDMLMLTVHQQKLAVNLESVGALGLMNYLEQPEKVDTAKEHEGEEDEAIVDSDPQQGTKENDTGEEGLADAANSLLETPEDSLTLPSLTKSGFVAITTLVKRLEMESENPVLSMIVMTIDGVLYFFDLPADVKIPFDSSTPLAKAWEAVLASEFKRQMRNMTEKKGADVVIVVPPPLPSKRFLLPQCSVEMTNVDCVAHFVVPESQGEDFRIELASPRLQIAFIDAFHACKFQEDAADIMADTDVSDNISDVSDSDDEDFDQTMENGPHDEGFDRQGDMGLGQEPTAKEGRSGNESIGGEGMDLSGSHDDDSN